MPLCGTMGIPQKQPVCNSLFPHPLNSELKNPHHQFLTFLYGTRPERPTVESFNSAASACAAAARWEVGFVAELDWGDLVYVGFRGIGLHKGFGV